MLLTIPDTRDFELQKVSLYTLSMHQIVTYILVDDYASSAPVTVIALERGRDSPVGVFLIVALRTASMNSADVGTGAMPWRPATEAIVYRLWVCLKMIYAVTATCEDDLKTYC